MDQKLEDSRDDAMLIEHRMKLLIVEDVPFSQRLLRMQLEAEGHDVVVTSNGVEALEALEREPFDGVVSDIVMPEMDGLRLCCEVRRNERLQDLPFVLYTSKFDSPGDRALARDVGVDAYVSKPAPIEEIVAAVHAAIKVGRDVRSTNKLPSESLVLKHYNAALVRNLEEQNIKFGELNEQLNDVLDHSYDIIETITPEGRLLYVNRAWHEMLGYGADEVEALDVFDLIDERCRPRFRRLFDDLQNGKSLPNIETVLNAKDGRRLLVEGSATAKIVDGAVTMIHFTWRDVTARKAAEASSKRLAAIVESSEDAIIGKDLDGTVTSWNSSAERIFGYAAAEMIGVSISRLIPDNRRGEEATILHRLRGGERVEHFESVRLRKGGRPIDVSLTVSPVVNAAGEIVGVSKIARDITLRQAAEASRRAADERLAGLVDASMDAIITIDAEQRITLFNGAAERMFGWTQDEAIGTPLDALIPQQSRDVHRAHVSAYGRSGATSRRMGSLPELVALDRDGRQFPVEVSISQMEMADGHYYTAILRDITERREHERRIARLSRIRAVLSGINSAIVRIRERQALFEEACRIAVEEGGFKAAWIGDFDTVTGDVTLVASGGLDSDASAPKASARHDEPEGQGLVGRAIRSRTPVLTNAFETDEGAGGVRRPHLLALGIGSAIAMPLFVDETVSGVLVLFATEADFFSDDEMKLLLELAGDVSFALSYLEKAKRADYLAYYDALTGLPNRTLFIDRLTQALHAAAESETGVAVVIGDIDKFRRINEGFGRQSGDALLHDVAALIRPFAPDPDNVARTGADEFAAILTGSRSPTDIAHLIEDWQTGLGQAKIDTGERAITVSMTLGAAIAPQDGQSAEVLFRNAEVALQDAKRSGARYRFYEASMTARIAETLLLENKLRTAIADGQFELYYQPKVDALRGTVTGFEALLRWNDPDRGLVGPAAFIPILEETGMIIDVGAWVIKRALAQMQAWRREGVPAIRVAVNVSPRQFERGDFTDTVASLVAGDVPLLLDFEITEALVMGDVTGNGGVLDSIRRLGIEIAIDDFGTGYSSLAYLARLPVNALKIDRSFIGSMTATSESMTIVSTIISLAHAMNLKVIAEGVETEEQAKFLRLLKCDELQGYLFSRPLPADQARDFLLAQAARR